jgi:hypothetical protein
MACLKRAEQHRGKSGVDKFWGIEDDVVTRIVYISFSGRFGI